MPKPRIPVLEQLIIRNFQAHAKFILDFSPTVNCLVGKSDVGKSAVLRALRWLSLNKPQGEAFLREGQEHVSVRLKVDGHDILRERGTGLNSYSFDGHRFQAFGHDVPPEIASLLNVSELTFARQHDSPYWLSLSPGQVSRELNAVVDLEVIDASLSFIASEVRSSRSEIEVSEKRLAQAEEERDRLAWVKEASESLLSLSTLEGRIREELLKRSRINDLLLEGERLTLEGDRLALGLLEGFLALQKGEEVLARAKEAENVRILLDNSIRLEEERCRLDESLADVRKELEELIGEGKLCPLCGQEVQGPSRS